MARTWKIKPHDEALVRAIEKTANVSPVIAQILAIRGFGSATEIKKFIDAPLTDLRPGNQLPGVVAASEEIWRAICADEKIVVYGDYDADGMTATAILVRCFKLLGGRVSYFVPSRLDDGYGLNHRALQKLSEEGAQLIVTVDCGIASLEEAEQAKSLGLRLIITDHHQFGSTLPAAQAIVHPALPMTDDSHGPGADATGCYYPFPDLCGAGVALKLAWSLCQVAGDSEKVSAAQRSFLLMALGLAAIGTIADVVPLVDENRLIVKHGLQFLQHETVPGVVELMKLTGLNQKSRLASEDIGFTLAPRLNAAGRLGQAQLGVELLTTDSQSRAEALAHYIHQLNDNRDSLERKISKAANQEIREKQWNEHPAIVIAGRDWHVGVIGIVAGRIAEKFNRPTVVISQNDTVEKPAVGSARSACGVNLYEAFRHCSGYLASWGGHKMAAGLKIDETQIDVFRGEFVSYVAETTPAEMFEPSLDIDAEVPLGHLTLDTVEQLEDLAPFGQAHRRPVFCACRVRLAGDLRKMGGGERHLGMQIQQDSVRLRGIAFGHADWAEPLANHDCFDVAFQPMINEFRGWRKVELRIIDWRPSHVAATI